MDETLGEVPPECGVPTVVDALLDPDRAAAFFASNEPGADAVAALSAIDPAGLSDAGRIDLLTALARQAAWLAAVQTRALAAIGWRSPAGSLEVVGDELACEVGPALRLAPSTAQAWLGTANDLAGRFPATLSVLESGRISAGHARLIVEELALLDDTDAAAVEAAVLPKAPEQTLAEFRRAVRRQVKKHDRRRQDQQRAAALAERRVLFTPRGDGMTELWALLPAEGAATVQAAVNALASVTWASDSRSIDQRRADALVDLGAAALADPNLPRSHGLRPAVQVTVSLETLLGLSDEPGELAGHGPISAEHARQIALTAGGTWRRLVIDRASGELLDYGTTTYTPPPRLAGFVIARDRVCQFAGCNQPAHRCELDHRQPFPTGPTNKNNLQPLCKRHHRLKHHSRWRIIKKNGRVTWTSPTKHRYTKYREEFP